MQTRKLLLEELHNTVQRFLAVIHTLPDPDISIYDGWSARDILGHITFWHESFARNVRDLATGVKPSPLKGRLTDLNPRGVEEMRQYRIDEVINKLVTAQQVIQDYIPNPGLEKIPYRIGSRDYTPEEHDDNTISQERPGEHQ